MHYELAHSSFGDEEKQAILDVVKSDRYTMGQHVKEFETQFASFFGADYAVMVNSGSSANLVAVASLFFHSKYNLKRGDEVIVPCISWATTFYPLHQYGLKLKFVDIDINTLNYDMNALERAISPETRMIVAVSVLGNPCRFDRMVNLCETNNIILFEDNCESMGAKFNGRYTGTFGLVNTFSTFFSHHISTMEGGLILTNDKEMYCLLRSIRNHGWTRDQDEDSMIYEKKGDDFFEAYRFILPGYNVRPTEIQGVIGKEQLKKLPDFIEIRRKNADRFVNYFKDDNRFIIQRETGESSWFSFTMIVNPEGSLQRDNVMTALKNAGIEYRIITGGNFLRHDVIKYIDYTCESCENADLAHYSGFFIGNAPVDLSKEIDHLYNTLKNH